MVQRTICIHNAARLSVRDCSLVVESETGHGIVPLEDIWVVIIESHRVVATAALLSSLAEAGIGVIVCGRDHMPCALQLPLAAHSRHAAIVENQLLMSRPLKKQLWRRIVEAKIRNQALCLRELCYDDYLSLLDMSRHVLSGDSSNRESVAASFYFKRLITEGNRRNGPFVAPLDYGYSIVRGGVGREAVGGGWLVSRGLHHCNDLNPFNLVDDLMEPFRPMVDLLVRERCLYGSFDGMARYELSRIFEYKVLLEGKEYPIQVAIAEMMRSLKRAVTEEDSSLLLLPELIPLKVGEVDER